MPFPSRHKVLTGAFAAALTATLALTSPATADHAHHGHQGDYGHQRSHGHHGHHSYQKGHSHQKGHGLEPRTHFRMQPDGSSGTRSRGAQIPNIDSVKATIAAYYGDDGDGTADMDSSPYISELHRIQNQQRHHLRRAYQRAIRRGEKPALVFDADDTTLMTYDMEVAAMHFEFDPELQDEWVQDQRFPATPGMVDFVNDAEDMGYAIFGLTGRNADQEEATLGNLDKVGYEPFNAANFFTEWVDPAQRPDYIECAESECTTVEYKAGTRKHIEQDLGYDIVLNVGDQWSDLKGGYADRVLKLPNPTYYLPSPNLPGKHEPWLSPRTHFTMKPDGSSGRTEGGEGIPNVDSTKSTIRAYYNATDGIADKHASTYKHEVERLAHRWTPRLKRTCRWLDRRGEDPAIVLDADDTTLWTYDMEDAAM
ncbi:MAG TPA: HAD family acid phosphatase, partial [Nocardioidaceae bacterium]|nr:HAD family acid phosphatase [Nocardioidaceae bacterium]